MKRYSASEAMVSKDRFAVVLESELQALEASVAQKDVELDDALSLAKQFEEVSKRNAAQADQAIEQTSRAVSLVERFKADGNRLNWLEANPRIGQIVVAGKQTDCYVYAVTGAPGLKLREILDACIKADGEKK